MIDVEFRYTGFTGLLTGKCRLLILESGPGHLVILEELLDNEGASITNRSGYIMTEVCKVYQLDPDQVVFIEHALPIPGLPDFFTQHRFYQIDAQFYKEGFQATDHKLISMEQFIELVKATGADWTQLRLAGFEQHVG